MDTVAIWWLKMFSDGTIAQRRKSTLNLYRFKLSRWVECTGAPSSEWAMYPNSFGAFLEMGPLINDSSRIHSKIELLRLLELQLGRERRLQEAAKRTQLTESPKTLRTEEAISL
ncbi:hypothetical protein TNCV_3204951 [Trichonephila clavipes]|nr:hypothetical protein TNCV_3204951 [Trichonephila clavipes]